MSREIDIEKFLDLRKDVPVVDVRSPMEYEKGHIPGAINIPLFSDEERADVGTKFKHSGKELAILTGLDYVGLKMTSLAKAAIKVAPGRDLLVHCWRGGMRSANMAWLFNVVGLRPSVLKGGYKSYRRYVRSSFDRKANIIVLSGATGSGKTDILIELERIGEQVLHLEKYACHKGSAFGSIGQLPQPSTEYFENFLFDDMQKFDLNRTIWVEDESLMIGKVAIPSGLFYQMRNTHVVHISVPKEDRIERLVSDYTGFDHSMLEEAVRRISKRLGGLNTQLCVEALAKKDYYTVADLSLTYYDKAYEFGLNKRDKQLIHNLLIKSSSPVDNAKFIIKFVNESNWQRTSKPFLNEKR